MKTDLITVAHVKKYARLRAEEMRPEWAPSQISQQFLDDLNTKVRLLIDGAIAHHPTIGKTIKFLF